MPRSRMRLQSSLQDQTPAAGAKFARFFLTSAPARGCQNFCTKTAQTGFLQCFQNSISFSTGLSTKNGHNWRSKPFSSISKRLFFIFFNGINPYPRRQKENFPRLGKILFCVKTAQK
ncbi:MAG: hypothetical protein Q4D61_08975 [Cardiobacteriaceae bacterium]|nr:hypothetical protein [Cardiobacteriaceae bacterium]